MLVLSRKKNEVVYIVNDTTGELITIQVLDARGRASIGFDAPQNYKIIRQELYDKNKAGENQVPLPSPETLPVEVDKAIHFSGQYNESN